MVFVPVTPPSSVVTCRAAVAVGGTIMSHEWRCRLTLLTHHPVQEMAEQLDNGADNISTYNLFKLQLCTGQIVGFARKKL